MIPTGGHCADNRQPTSRRYLVNAFRIQMPDLKPQVSTYLQNQFVQ
jgi:hypothetical protein